VVSRTREGKQPDKQPADFSFQIFEILGMLL